jgi:hypothetical protein
MRHLVVIIIFAISFTVNPIHAGQNEYNDCLLSHLVNAKVDLAAQIMKRACRENFRDFTIALEKRKEYNECMLLLKFKKYASANICNSECYPLSDSQK